jgi:hypothetical protein
MINGKGCHSLLCVMEKEGKRVKYWRDIERECMRARASEGREVVSVQR